MSADLLSSAEATQLADCEARIERGLPTFIEVGRALLTIRDGRLYRSGYGTFEGYCRKRWDFDSSHARRLTAAAEVLEIVAGDEDQSVPVGTERSLPQSERVARELTSLRSEPEKLREVWTEAVERSNGKPTAAVVREVREEFVPNPGVTEVLESSTDLQQARYLHEFAKVLVRANALMEFDPSKLGQMADADLAESIEAHASRISEFADSFRRARRNLRVISGGVQ